MPIEVPVNPDVLRWARETAGLSPDQVASKLHRKSISAQTVLAWEDGSGAPTYPQLETLAYKIYRRPLALFFFPAPPQEETPNQSFRTLPEQEIRHLSPRIRYLLRQAQVMQLNLGELYDGKNPAERHIVRDLRLGPSTSPVTMATEVRRFLGIELHLQTAWQDADEAFKAWRTALENNGIFVFKDAFKEDGFSGFCLYDPEFPIIYVNNSKPDTRQIFTLFHELAHLLAGTGGVDTRLEDYIDLLYGDARVIEILANRFAGTFLVPDADFDQRIEGLAVTDDNVWLLARRYCVSREVVLRKLLDRGLVEQGTYERRAADWASEAARGPRGGGNYYLTKRTYLGERYLERAFSRYYQQKISTEQLASYLGVKVKNVPGMEELLLRPQSLA